MLNSDEIRITYSQYGDSIDKIELLLLPKAKLILKANNDEVNMIIKDTDFDDNNVNGKLGIETLEVLIKQLVKMRNQIKKG